MRALARSKRKSMKVQAAQAIEIFMSEDRCQPVLLSTNSRILAALMRSSSTKEFLRLMKPEKCHKAIEKASQLKPLRKIKTSSKVMKASIRKAKNGLKQLWQKMSCRNNYQRQRRNKSINRSKWKKKSRHHLRTVMKVMKKMILLAASKLESEPIIFCRPSQTRLKQLSSLTLIPTPTPSTTIKLQRTVKTKKTQMNGKQPMKLRWEPSLLTVYFLTKSSTTIIIRQHSQETFLSWEAQ